MMVNDDLSSIELLMVRSDQPMNHDQQVMLVTGILITGLQLNNHWCCLPIHQHASHCRTNNEMLWMVPNSANQWPLRSAQVSNTSCSGATGFRGSSRKEQHTIPKFLARQFLFWKNKHDTVPEFTSCSYGRDKQPIHKNVESPPKP